MSAVPDIVQVLRSEVPDPLMRSWPTVARDAADEIERLRDPHNRVPPHCQTCQCRRGA